MAKIITTPSRFTSTRQAAGAAQGLLHKGKISAAVVGDEMPEGAIYEDQRRYYVSVQGRRFYSAASLQAAF